MEDVLQFSFQLILELEGVQTLVTLTQLSALLEREDAGGAESLISRPGWLIALAPVTAFAPLLLQFQTGEKEVLPGRPDRPVQFADRLHQGRVLQASVTQELTGPGP